jgi:hypothetical protein
MPANTIEISEIQAEHILLSLYDTTGTVSALPGYEDYNFRVKINSGNDFIFKISRPNEDKNNLYFHHFNPDIFSKLIYDNIGRYNAYIIIPTNIKDTHVVIEKLPKNKVYLLDQSNEKNLQYPAIFQNFEKDIFNGHTKGLSLLKKYDTLVLLFQELKQSPRMLKGFNLYCKMNAYNNGVINSLENRIPKKGEIYLIPDDRNLIHIIKKIKEEKLTLAKDVGIISYYDI